METDGRGKEGIHVKSKDEKEMMPQISPATRDAIKVRRFASAAAQHNGEGGNSQGNSEVRRFRKLGASLAV